MQLSRARFLSSDGTMIQGAKSVSVALSMMSRAREYSYHLLRDARSIGLSFHWRSGSLMRALKRRSCSSSLTSSQNFTRMMPSSTMACSNWGQSTRKRRVLRFGAEAHHIFDAGPIVPAAVEDHDFARGRKMGHVALQVELRLLAVGGRGQRHHPEHARAHPLGDRLDRPALAGGVASLEHDDHAQALVLDPFLQRAEVDLQLAQRLVIVLAPHGLFDGSHGCRPIWLRTVAACRRFLPSNVLC